MAANIATLAPRNLANEPLSLHFLRWLCMSGSSIAPYPTSLFCIIVQSSLSTVFVNACVIIKCARDVLTNAHERNNYN